MFVIASLLDPAGTLQTQKVWQRLHDNCGLAGIQLTPLPHFTWQAATEYDFDAVDRAMKRVLGSIKPFTISSSGIGIFTGESPVIYSLLVKNRALMDAHHLIWKELNGAGVGINQHYHPENWIPHVTLAYRDVNRNNLPCALSDLAFQPLGMEVIVDHLAVLYDIDGEIGMKIRYDFQTE